LRPTRLALRRSAGYQRRKSPEELNGATNATAARDESPDFCDHSVPRRQCQLRRFPLVPKEGKISRRVDCPAIQRPREDQWIRCDRLGKREVFSRTARVENLDEITGYARKDRVPNPSIRSVGIIGKQARFFRAEAARDPLAQRDDALDKTAVSQRSVD